MKLTLTQVRVLTVALAGLLILFGISKAVFHFDLGARNEKWISDGLFFAAAMCILWSFKLRKEEAQKRAAEEQEAKVRALSGEAPPPEEPKSSRSDR